MSASPRILNVALGLLLLGVLSVPVQAQATRDPNATAAYEQGLKFMEEKKWDDAIAAFAKATEIDQTFAEAYVGRADALRELEDFTSALQVYRQAENLNQKLPGLYLGRGIAYREVGDINMAMSDFDNAMELDRSNPEIMANLGDLLVNYVQNPTRALQVLNKAIELDPNNAKAYRNRALAHTQMRHFDEAEADLAKSVELKNDDFETYSVQATIYLFQDKPEKLPNAIEALSKAIENYKNREKQDSADPKVYVQGYLQRANAYMKLASDPKTPIDKQEEFYSSAINDADAVLAEMPEQYPISGNALYTKGVAERMQGNFGEAIKALTDAIQQLPPGESGSYASEAYRKRGICWHLQGENRLARGDFQQAAAIDYTDPLPHMWTGFTFVEEGDYRSAIDAYGEAIAKNPNFPLPYINRGLAYLQLGEYNRAADNFNEAIRVEPSNPDSHVKRGLTYMMLEDYQKALNAFDLALQYDEDNIEALEGTIEALRQLGRSSTAETYAKRIDDVKAKKD